MIIRKATLFDFPQLLWEEGLKEWQELIEKDLKDSLSGKNVYLVGQEEGLVVGQIYI